METPLLSPRRIITLLSDFGSQDYFVGAMKGVILSINPRAQIVDITHEIPPQDIHAASFNLLAAYTAFPPGTIHVAVVDPGVGSERRPLAIECAGQSFVGPDNGLFSWICEREGKARAIHLKAEEFFHHPVSTTFHGRDVFAPVAAALSNGIPVEEMGDQVGDYVRLESLALRPRADRQTEARIIHIDRFGNCVTNLTREHLKEESFVAGAQLTVNGQEIKSYRRFFAEAGARAEELFCIFGSAGFLEIAKQNSSAAAVLNARRGDQVLLTPGTS
ncbi:MAG: SAM-dependent chlorinase/fluorinase [Acidobacteriota bacterium]